MSSHTDRLRAAVAARAVRTLLHRGRRVDDRVVLLAGVIGGNLAALALALRSQHPETELAFLLARRTSPHPAMPGRVLRPWRLRDLVLAARARVVVTSQGPGPLRTWLSSRHRPLFVDVWHGVGFKSRVATARPEFRTGYDAHFVSSPFVAEFYRRTGARAVVTGYGRMDAVVLGQTDATVPGRLDALFDGRCGPTVLLAPTWGITRAVPDRDALESLAGLADELGARIAYRPHVHAPTVDVSAWPAIRLVGPDVVQDAVDLLPHVAVLVTDWSSIASDYLPLGAPIVYIDAPRPARSTGPLTDADRPGPIVRDADELVDAVRRALSDPEAHASEHRAAREATVERAWADTLDGRSSIRYIEAIERLERERGEETGA